MAPVKVLNRRHQKQTGDMSSGAGPCSVVNKSKTVIFIHTDSHSLSNTNTHTHRVLWLRQWWQVRLQWGQGKESENRWSGLMAVKAPITESALLPHHPRLSPHPSLLCSAALLKVTQMTSDWLAPVKKVRFYKRHLLISLMNVCVCIFVSSYLLPIALTGSTQMFVPEQSIHSVPCLVLVGVT